MQSVKTELMLVILFVGIQSYDTGLANLHAHLSAIAYDSATNIDGWKCGECSNFAVKSQKTFFSSAANIQGYGFLDVKNNAVTIAFRGSVDIKNWIYNLNTAIVNYPGCSGCQVHQGFYSAYTGVAPLVRTMVNSLLSTYKGAKLVITGHSLGGAMAILCALDMKQLHGKVDYVYTYGQPRVGNQNFATFLQAQVPNTFRVINYADMVPHVPPSAFTFKHGGKQIWYNPRGMKTYKICVSQDKACANSMVASGLSTDDHNVGNYETLAVTNSIFDANRQFTNIRDQDSSTQNLTDEEIAQLQVRRIEQIKNIIDIELTQRGSNQAF